MLIITGGGTMKLLFKTLCEDNNDINGTMQLHACNNAHSLTGAEWFLVFTCVAILIAQLPNLNSLAAVSLVGAVTAVSYCTLFWSLSVKKGRPDVGVSYTPSLSTQDSTVLAKIGDILNAVGIIVLAFRGHNVLLEIQASTHDVIGQCYIKMSMVNFKYMTNTCDFGHRYPNMSLYYF